MRTGTGPLSKVAVALALTLGGAAPAAALPFAPIDIVTAVVPVQWRSGGLSRSFGRASGSTATAHRSQSAREMASGLRDGINRNRVEVRRGDGRSTVYDLGGRGHYEKSLGREVPTPHKHTTTMHSGPTGRSATKGAVEPMTKQDVRSVRRVIEIRNAGERRDGK